jgi:Na+/proline symporter
MQILDIITIVVFSLGILLAGISFSKSGKNMNSFFAAGGQVPLVDKWTYHSSWAFSPPGPLSFGGR